MQIDTKHGRALIPRGFLSDGATGVFDLCKEGYFLHDLLYLRGKIDGKPITKWQADVIYGKLLWKNHRYIRAFIRPLGLAIFGHKAWNNYRRLDKENPLHWMSHFVPRKECWSFPNWNTSEAVWTAKPLHGDLKKLTHPLS